MTSPNDEVSPRLLPMFPLGSVLVPSMLLPLHIFEPRYRALIRDVLDSDGEFGVVMIERGSEVGGDDVRAGVGCVARVLEAEEQPDGRWIVMAVGTAVVDVQSWSADDPYPRAVVVERDGPAADVEGAEGSAIGRRPALARTGHEVPRGARRRSRSGRFADRSDDHAQRRSLDEHLSDGSGGAGRSARSVSGALRSVRRVAADDPAGVVRRCDGDPRRGALNRRFCGSRSATRVRPEIRGRAWRNAWWKTRLLGANLPTT